MRTSGSQSALDVLLLLALVIAIGSCLYAFIGREQAVEVDGYLQFDIGHCRFDGTLDWEIGIDRFECDGITFELTLVHEVGLGVRGEGESDWRVRGIGLYMIENNSGGFEWTGPTGDQIELEKNGRTGTYNTKNRMWSLESTAKGSMKVEDSIGNEWHFVGSILRSVRNSSGETIMRVSVVGSDYLRFDCEHEEWKSLELVYECGKLVSYRRGETVEMMLSWSSSGRLTTVESAGQVIQIEYDQELVSRIREDGQEQEIFTWRANDLPSRVRHYWHVPVSLSSDSTSIYEFELISSGFHVKRRLLDGGVVYESIYNPKKGVIRQRRWGGGM